MNAVRKVPVFGAPRCNDGERGNVDSRCIFSSQMRLLVDIVDSRCIQKSIAVACRYCRCILSNVVRRYSSASYCDVFSLSFFSSAAGSPLSLPLFSPFFPLFFFVFRNDGALRGTKNENSAQATVHLVERQINWRNL